MTVPVKQWWDNRDKLNQKMALSLRNEFVKMVTKSELAIIVQTPVFGKEREEVDRRNQALLDDLKAKIAEMDKILKKF